MIPNERQVASNQVKSAWRDHPDYRIDITPCAHTGQVWHGDTLIAESDSCVVVTETDHVDRLYFPESDVRWDLLTPSDRTTECPFKGRATYWDVAGAPGQADGVAWTYRTPLPEVAGIAGYVAFYDTHCRIEIVERWPDGRSVPASFPLWGDAAELLRVIDVEPAGEGRFVGPAHGPTWRNVVESGQSQSPSSRYPRRLPVNELPLYRPFLLSQRPSMHRSILPLRCFGMAELFPRLKFASLNAARCAARR